MEQQALKIRLEIMIGCTLIKYADTADKCFAVRKHAVILNDQIESGKATLDSLLISMAELTYNIDN